MTSPFYRTVRDISIGIFAVKIVEYLGTRTARELERNRRLVEEYLEKAETMKPIYDARSIDLSHLNPVRVSYAPKNLHCEAIQVSIENIGKLSLEFEEELFYDVHGRPSFSIDVKRFGEGEPDGQIPPIQLCVRLTDWIVPLWDELHIFRDQIFRNTFTFDDGGDHSERQASSLPSMALPIDWTEKTSGNIEGPTGTHVMPRIDE